MPTTINVGTPGPANKKIGGVPHVHYFDFFSRGRGQVLRLLFEDAGIAYTDTRYTFSEFPSHKTQALGSMNPLKAVPVVELNGKILVQSYPTLRFLARTLGAYDGTTSEEMYVVDQICDLGIDWRTLFVNAALGENAEVEYAKHVGEEGERGRYVKAVEEHLAASGEGPFVLGERVTYADLVIYQIVHDERSMKKGDMSLKAYPKLKALVEGVEARPGVKAFLESDRYHG